ncbi:MAG: chemotaxis protein CheV [Planctomycetota bacterium]
MEKLDAESYLQTGSNELRVLEYRVADQSFGINILKVSKIVSHLDEAVKLPESHPAVRGLFRDQGQVIPLIDLAFFLGVDRPAVDREEVIVTEFFGIQTGFSVDWVEWIHHFLWKDVIDATAVFSGINQRYVIGIVRPTDTRMILLLDYETILLDLSPHLRDGEKVSDRTSLELTGKRVLIAEDSPAVRSMLADEMADLGFEVDVVGDGEQGWEAFQKQSYDLVISDVEMPQMDGLALTMRIRQSDRPQTPVIVYSSIGDVGMKARAAFLKADAHITKLNLDLLVQTADKLMRGEKITVDESGEPEKRVTELETIPIG